MIIHYYCAGPRSTSNCLRLDVGMSASAFNAKKLHLYYESGRARTKFIFHTHMSQFAIFALFMCIECELRGCYLYRIRFVFFLLAFFFFRSLLSSLWYSIVARLYCMPLFRRCVVFSNHFFSFSFSSSSLLYSAHCISVYHFSSIYFVCYVCIVSVFFFRVCYSFEATKRDLSSVHLCVFFVWFSLSITPSLLNARMFNANALLIIDTLPFYRAWIVCVCVFFLFNAWRN